MIVRPVESRGKRITLGVMAFAILIPGAYGFLSKLYEFIHESAAGDEVGFTIFPLANYFFVTLGMACLFVWAVAHGMFRNIEEPKYTMLEREEELDRRQAL
ncbi:MAG: hypothetical protein ACE5GE_11960 [Phycisphaerae bacterium]